MAWWTKGREKLVGESASVLHIIIDESRVGENNNNGNTYETFSDTASQVRHIPARISDFTSAAGPRPQRATLAACLSMTSTICRSSSAGL